MRMSRTLHMWICAPHEYVTNSTYVNVCASWTEAYVYESLWLMHMSRTLHMWICESREHPQKSPHEPLIFIYVGFIWVWICHELYWICESREHPQKSPTDIHINMLDSFVHVHETRIFIDVEFVSWATHIHICRVHMSMNTNMNTNMDMNICGSCICHELYWLCESREHPQKSPHEPLIFIYVGFIWIRIW